MPRIDEIVDRISPAKFITTLDLAKGYYQVPLAKSARSKTAFITPQGKFEFTALPFGLKNAPASFQRLMDSVLAGQQSSTTYIDDVVVHSNSWEQHLEDLENTLKRLTEAGLTVKQKKCCFAGTSVSFLGLWWAREKSGLKMPKLTPSKPTSSLRPSQGLPGPGRLLQKIYSEFLCQDSKSHGPDKSK